MVSGPAGAALSGRARSTRASARWASRPSNQPPRMASATISSQRRSTSFMNRASSSGVMLALNRPMPCRSTHDRTRRLRCTRRYRSSSSRAAAASTRRHSSCKLRSESFSAASTNCSSTSGTSEATSAISRACASDNSPARKASATTGQLSEPIGHLHGGDRRADGRSGLGCHPRHLPSGTPPGATTPCCQRGRGQHPERSEEPFGLGAPLHHPSRFLRPEPVDLDSGRYRPDRSQHLIQQPVDPSVEHAQILTRGYDT